MDNLYNASEKALERVEKITGKKVIFYKEDMLNKEGMNTDARHRGRTLPPTRLCLPLFLVHQLKGEKGGAVANRGLKWAFAQLPPAKAATGPMAGTAGYRSLRSLCACLAVFNFEIKGKFEHRRPLSAPRPPSPALRAAFSRATVSAPRPSFRRCSLRQSAEL